MTIHITRYYGDSTITKSYFSIEGTPFQCEAREPAYRDYTESFTGCSRYCLPTGQWKAHIKSSTYSPMTLILQPCPGHRSAKVIYSYLKQADTGNIVIGRANPQDEPEYRQIEQSHETFLQLEKLLYEAYGRDEEIIVKIENPKQPY